MIEDQSQVLEAKKKK